MGQRIGVDTFVAVFVIHTVSVDHCIGHTI